jgi:hypothetical protein
MTRDLDTLLRDADPLRDRPADDDSALLIAARERVDRKRALAGCAPGRRRPRWGHRVTLIAAAAAILTAVPLVLSAVLDDDAQPRVLQAAVAADGSIVCGSGYAAAIDPGDASVRLLPDRTPAGWSYAQIFAREDTQYGWCVPPSFTALQEDAEGRVTGRISVTGPIPARIDRHQLDRYSTPDTLNGRPARRFDAAIDFPVHRWLWTDDQDRVWEAEASGMALDAGREALAAVAVNGAEVAWDAASLPGWRLVHLREGPPYGPDPRRLNWYVEMTDGTRPRMVTVDVAHGATAPLLAGVAVGDQVTTVGGHPAVLSRPRTLSSQESGGAPEAQSIPVLVEVAPGTVAWSWSVGDDLPEVQEMLASLRQVSAADPRLAKYGTD